MITQHFPSPFQFPNAWRIDNIVFLSGQVSMTPDGTIVGRGDIAVQTRTTFENLKTVLEESGSSLDRIVKLNTYLVYRGAQSEFEKYWADMNEARSAFISNPAPAATAVIVAGLAHPDFLIEVDAIATIR